MTSGPRALLAAPGADRALRKGLAGRLEIALGCGGYVRLGEDGWLLLAGPRDHRGPLSLVVAGLDGQPARAGSPVRVEGATLVVGPHRIALAGARRAGPVWSPGRGGDLDGALAAARAVCPPPPRLLHDGIAALECGDARLAVEALAGRGDGLTPAGDDVLAGYAGWAAAAGRPPRLSAPAAERCSPIGLAYLRCAGRGELPDLAARVLAAVRAGDAGAARRRARALHGWGSSSGPALLWGFAAARRAELALGGRRGSA